MASSPDRIAGVPRAELRRTLRRSELRQMVPLADTTIYEMEQRGEFPRRFNISPRCVVWDYREVEQWLEDRKQADRVAERPPIPDVRLRRTRPVRGVARDEAGCRD